MIKQLREEFYLVSNMQGFDGSDNFNVVKNYDISDRFLKLHIDKMLEALKEIEMHDGWIQKKVENEIDLYKTLKEELE